MLNLARLSSLLLSALWAPAAPQVIWLDVPFVQQVGNGCGAACISMIMRYWHRSSASARMPDDTQIIGRLFSEEIEGVRAADLARFLQEQDYRVFTFNGNRDDLEHHLQKGRPLIVGIKQSSGTARFHFVVVAGLDPAQDLILVNDPARRKLIKLRRADFERDWKECGNWTLLALPPNEK